jgi:hypothetical protein
VEISRHSYSHLIHNNCTHSVLFWRCSMNC